MRDEDKKITTSRFLKKLASTIPLVEATESASAGQLISKVVLSGKGTLTNAYEKVMGSHKELKRGYDFLVSDTEVLNLIPIGKYSRDSNPNAQDITDIERFAYILKTLLLAECYYLIDALYSFNTHPREKICRLLAHKISDLGLKTFAEIVYAINLKEKDSKIRRSLAQHVGEERVQEIGSSPKEQEEDYSSNMEKEYTPTVIYSEFTEDSVRELSLYQKTMKCGDQR
jgi:hypothetical protein